MNSNGYKEHLHSNNTATRFDGYNIYRDNLLIGWVPTEQNTFTDTDIVFGDLLEDAASRYFFWRQRWAWKC